MTDEARTILRADNAALLGILGVLPIVLSALGGPYLQSILAHKTYLEALPKNLNPLELNRAVLVSDLVNSFSPLALTASVIVAITGLTTAGCI